MKRTIDLKDNQNTENQSKTKSKPHHTMKKYIVIGTTNTNYKSFEFIEAEDQTEALGKFFIKQKVGFNFYDKVEVFKN